MVVTHQKPKEAFTSFFADVEPRLRHALVASRGPEAGREAAADALAYAWEHWDRISKMNNPAGYLYRVGCSAAKRYRGHSVGLPELNDTDQPWVEPGLDGALQRLSSKQRTAVVLMHSFGWTHAEVADLLGVTVSTVQKHAKRGLTKLREALEVKIDS